MMSKKVEALVGGTPPKLLHLDRTIGPLHVPGGGSIASIRWQADSPTRIQWIGITVDGTALEYLRLCSIRVQGHEQMATGSIPASILDGERPEDLDELALETVQTEGVLDLTVQNTSDAEARVWFRLVGVFIELLPRS